MASLVEDEIKIFNNRYQILEKIGQGGLAEVYRAQDVALGRIVAVKALRPEYVSDPTFLVRFHREAQSAAGLIHPNIVAVYDFGQDHDRPYIVMEYVPGLDLRTLLEQNGALSIRQAVDICGQVCAGVGYAHRAGLVHGDLKPGNVLIRLDGQAKVVDFGLARALGESAMDEAGELVWGTPAYFAPEQAAGGHVVPATDVYAIGVILYEALTGQLPFTGDDHEVARKHLYEKPPPAHRINPRLPVELSRIIERALHKKPEERFATAEEMGAALADFYHRSEKSSPSVASSQPLSKAVLSGHGARSLSRRFAIDGLGLMLGLLTVVAVLGLAPLLAAVLRVHIWPAVSWAPTPMATMAPGQVRVPDVVGMRVEHARRVLESIGLQMTVIGQAHHPLIPALAVAEQTIRAGEPVADGTTIGVVISQGPRLVEVPNVIGQPLGQAQAELERHNLVFEIWHSVSDRPPETVIAQEPPSGSLVQERSLIVLTVSDSNGRVPVGARWGDHLLLVRYELLHGAYAPGDTLAVALTWQATAPVNKPAYTVAVHLARPDGTVIAQHEGTLAGGTSFANVWAPGEQIVDTHPLSIPATTIAGEYQVRVGISATGGPLPITDAAQREVAGTMLVLASIHVGMSAGR
ncbi:MAG: protein kinase domain-containing protein [Anaerolineae bacterium]